MNGEIERELQRLHSALLKGNEYDESDLLFYRINYRLAESLGIPNAQAQIFHEEYHVDRPRCVSQGYCDTCRKIVTLIPIIYGIQSEELSKMRRRELEGSLIIGNTDIIKEGQVVAMFGCRECKSASAKYGAF